MPWPEPTNHLPRPDPVHLRCSHVNANYLMGSSARSNSVSPGCCRAVNLSVSSKPLLLAPDVLPSAPPKAPAPISNLKDVPLLLARAELRLHQTRDFVHADSLNLGPWTGYILPTSPTNGPSGHLLSTICFLSTKFLNLYVLHASG